ncbi:MAG: sulfatase [Planctomycetes bacterium]|nr:sulfatase [Planctomycetota bacterium]
MNFLFITVDDMNCDSIGVYGSKVMNTTPNIDRLASEGMQFKHAHVQVANCNPSRNTFHSGLYPHKSGIVGFYGPSKPKFTPLPELLRQNGYALGVIGKVEDMMPMNKYKWDMTGYSLGLGKLNARIPNDLYKFTKGALAWAKNKNMPFYLNVNLVDPHKPFYGSKKDKGNPRPSKVYSASEIVVPDFLPDLPDVRKELAQYYSSVRRADDALGRVMSALKEEGMDNNTIVMFVSDHGMPLPFAKTNLYHHSTHTPWLVRFPPQVKAHQVDDNHMISAIDFYPTVCELLGVNAKHSLDGKSIVPLLKGVKQTERNQVFKEYHENAGATPLPMRAVEDQRYVYIFNPWHYGKSTFKSATLYTDTFRAMSKSKDKNIQQRRSLFLRRPLEELYDISKDPSCLNNLAESVEFMPLKEKMSQQLLTHMKEHGDLAAEALENIQNPEIIKKWIVSMQNLSKKAWADPNMDKKRHQKKKTPASR